MTDSSEVEKVEGGGGGGGGGGGVILLLTYFCTYSYYTCNYEDKC